MKENKRKCSKCGSSPADDPETALYRFPKPGSTNVSRCELWAKYCFPDQPWSSANFQAKLHSEHRMLCHHHFKESAFVDFSIKKLRRFAVPEMEEVTMPFLGIGNVDVAAGPSQQPLLDVTNRPSTSSFDPFKGSAASATTKETTAFDKCKKYLRKICQLKKQIQYLKNKTYLKELSTSDAVRKLSSKISPSFGLLLQAQIKNFKKSSKGRRWSSDDKYTALRLYKRSPTAYRLLRRMFCLPAPTTLKMLLRQCSLDVGINKPLFEVIQKNVSKLQKEDNQFVLMFDEMALKKHIQYNAREDLIEGYQDHGVQGRSQQPVSYALVFMIAGIRRKIKQPIAYYLSGSSVTADRLTALIKEVLVQCQEHNINIAATVCDLNAVNRRALCILGATTSSPKFKIDNMEIVALYDTPHLIKCFRNMFLKHDIKCNPDISSADGGRGTGLAKWNHIVQFYELDKANTNFVFAPCLKQDHLNPNNKQKMKVKLAVQVLSHTVAAGMFAKVSQGELTAEALATADVITKMDKLFDTLNSDSNDLRRGKPFSTNLRENTKHIAFLKEMLLFFKNIEFVGTRAPPSQDGWVWTINGVLQLWETLHHNHKNIKSLATRRLQQDPLENLFGCVRSNCGANTNPTTGQFVAGLKTSILGNLTHVGYGKNCENDENEAIIHNFKTLFKKNESLPCTEDSVKLTSVQAVVDVDEDKLRECGGEIQACAYVCGFIIKKFKTECATCKPIFTTTDHLPMHAFTEFKEYNECQDSLIYANKDFVLCVEQCATFINNYLNNNAHKKNLFKEINLNIKDIIDFEFLNVCTEHKETNLSYLLKSVAHITIKRFCLLKNRLFAEESSAKSLKKKIDILQHR